MMDKETHKQNLIRFFDRTYHIIGNRERFFDYLMLSENEYRRLLNNIEEFPLFSILSFCEKLNIQHENIIRNNVDYAVLRSQFNGNRKALKEEYTYCPNSLVKTAKNILDYFSPLYEQEIRSALKSLQINEVSLDNPSEKISIKLIDDIARELIEMGLPLHSFYEAGVKGAQGLLEIPNFSAGFNDCRNVVDLYELCFNSKIRVIDGNWDYQVIKLDESGCILKVKSKEEAKNIFATQYFGSKAIDYYRSGVTAGVASYITNNFANCEVINIDNTNEEYRLFKSTFYSSSKKQSLSIIH